MNHRAGGVPCVAAGSDLERSPPPARPFTKVNPMSNDGGPAFPCDFEVGRVVEHDDQLDTNVARQLLEARSGMSLRDWFAGQALAGILSNVEALRAQPPLTHAERAEAAYKAADAMLKQRDH